MLIARADSEGENSEIAEVLLKPYHELSPLYDKLADEIAFSLKKRLREQEIPFAHVTQRVKTFESLCKKVIGKQYADPWKEITDVAGVRVVFLYPSTRSRIEALIEKEFKVIERVDKAADLQEDRFGYSALHYVVALGEGTSGARYEDLKHLVCEIQVRTVMQDAWAIIDHHLVYKNEASVPSKFKRQLSEISGMFENIDRQFDTLRSQQEAYMEQVAKDVLKTAAFLQQELNFETMSAYLKQRFANLESGSAELINGLIENLSGVGVKKISDVDKILKQTEKARSELRKVFPPSEAIMEVGRAAALASPEFLTRHSSPTWRERYKTVTHLVEKE